MVVWYLIYMRKRLSIRLLPYFEDAKSKCSGKSKPSVLVSAISTEISCAGRHPSRHMT